MDVLLLAGGRCSPELFEHTGIEWRAELPIWGSTIVDRVIRVLQPFGQVYLVGHVHREQVTTIPGGESFIESLRRGMEQIQTEEFLLATADIPLLTAESVQDFLSRCDRRAALNYPIVRAECFSDALSQVHRTTLKLREGRFTGGNIALVQTKLMQAALPTMERAYAARKKPLKLAGIVGWGTLFRVALGQISPRVLSKASLESAVSRFLGAPVHAVISDHQGIGMDIDNFEQYRVISSLKMP